MTVGVYMKKELRKNSEMQKKMAVNGHTFR